MAACSMAGENMVAVRYDMKWDGYSEEEIELVVSQLPSHNSVQTRQRKYVQTSLLMRVC
jgi:hypothetical protein